jgi:demethylmenaquinone methyltransferase/2-methoxy-6-polyprenyl-1,4-benzoquinol methylase
MAAADAERIFTGIADTYDRVAAALSFGQDPRWRRALVDAIAARPADRVLDVATGTGLVARELRRRYGCRVVGLDQSADMLAVARTHDGVYDDLVLGRAERLPFPDATFDHLTFTYLLRYVDDPDAVMRELARVVKPGGRIAMLEFAVPRGVWRPMWWLYTRIGLPVVGRIVSPKWSLVGAFLGPSIERFYERHPRKEIERYWRNAGLENIHARTMSLGGGIVMSATRSGAPRAIVASPAMPPAFYAARSGGWRDYWTLLHPPYTAWHLSYVLLGAALAPSPDPRVVIGALVAFGLAVGVGAHAFDELRGRPLRTRIPSRVLVALGSLALATAAALGIIATTALGPLLLVFVIAGVALVVLYAFEVPIVHSDLGFGLAWGAFPVITTAYAVGAHPVPAVIAGAAAALLSLAQRRLSTRARSVRRRATAISGEIVYADGSRESVDARALIGAPEAALRLLWIAIVALAIASLVSRMV